MSNSTNVIFLLYIKIYKDLLNNGTKFRNFKILDLYFKGKKMLGSLHALDEKGIQMLT